MKTIAYALSLMLCVGSAGASAQEQDRNPTRDPAVEEGYQKHQAQHAEKVEAERAKAEADAREAASTQYTHTVSGWGHNGVPTSGGYPPPKENKPD